MPGLNLKTELQLYKQRLEEIISEINYHNTRIILKQIKTEQMLEQENLRWRINN